MGKLNQDLEKDLNNNVQILKEGIGQSSDILFHSFSIGLNSHLASLIYIEGLTETIITSEQVVLPLQNKALPPDEDIINYIANSILGIKTKKIRTFLDIEKELLQGKSILLVADYSVALSIETKKTQKRAIEDPENEAMLRGPKVGFIEELRTNTALIRQRANDPNLTIKEITIGERNQKTVSIIFIRGLAEQHLVEDIQSRIQNIKIDDPMESGYIEELIEDYPYSLFPQVQTTERPDRVVAALLEGRVAILLDGTPFSIIAPVTLDIFLQAPEDYYQRWIPSSLLRIIRYISIMITIFLPGLYIALISFHPGLLPTSMAITITGSRQSVPFPPFVEAIFMEVTLELLREAGLRLPKPIGQTLGLVGGVIIGQAAVQANIVSALMVVIVSITAISSFTIPHYEFGLPLRILRFLNMIFAGVFGIFGLIMYFLFLLGHLFQLKSFGYEFYQPSLAKASQDLRDSLIRFPLRFLTTHVKNYTSKK
ncbi:spore germination protein [Priestia megaterium]